MHRRRRRDPSPSEVRQHARRREYLDQSQRLDRCPYCETPATAMTGSQGERYREARPGEWGICQGCAAPLIATDRGVRRPTDEEAAALAADEEAQWIAAQVALFHAWKRSSPNE